MLINKATTNFRKNNWTNNRKNLFEYTRFPGYCFSINYENGK